MKIRVYGMVLTLEPREKTPEEIEWELGIALWDVLESGDDEVTYWNVSKVEGAAHNDGPDPETEGVWANNWAVMLQSKFQGGVMLINNELSPNENPESGTFPTELITKD